MSEAVYDHLLENLHYSEVQSFTYFLKNEISILQDSSKDFRKEIYLYPRIDIYDATTWTDGSIRCRDVGRHGKDGAP